MSKTILHILNTGSYSGAENVVITIIESFRKFGYSDINFVYVSLDGSIRDVLKEKKIKFESIKNMSLSGVTKVIQKYSPDIIHAHDFTASIICAAVAGKIPVISHIHNNSPWIKKYCINSFVYGLSCLKYKVILGVSNSVFDEYVFGKYIKNKAKVIGNPIDIQAIHKKADIAEDKSSYDIVFLGRLSEPKNPIGFVDIIEMVAERVPDITAVMIGAGELESEVSNRICKKKLNNNIIMKGFMSNPYGVLKASKILCMPSKWEGYGLAAVEALALGKPVVAAPVGGLPNILTEGGTLCTSNETFLSEIVNFITNAEYYHNISEQAEARAIKLNNVHDYALGINTIYNDLYNII